jgi:hypothetical protein
MKSFFEFYQVLKAKQLLEQDMAAPQVNPQTSPDFNAQQMGAMVPPVPQAPAPAMPAGQAAPPVDAAAQAQAPAPAGEDSNVSASVGEPDTSAIDGALQALRDSIPNLKSKDETLGGEVEEVLNQLSQKIDIALGRAEEQQEAPEGGEGSEQAPEMGMPGGLQGMEAQMGADQAADMGGMDMGGAAAAEMAPPAGM